MLAGLQMWVALKLDIEEERQTNRGYQVFTVCPYCGKDRSHFSINVETGIYGCYICGNGHGNKNGGSYVQLVIDVDQLDVSSSASWRRKKEIVDKYLAEFVEDLSLSELEKLYEPPAPLVNETETISVLELKQALPGVVSVFEDCPQAVEARKYLFDERKISEAIAIELSIGVGLKGRLAGRVVIPIWEKSKIVSYVARAVGSSGLRYLGPAVGSGWKSRSKTVFGLDRINGGDTVVVVEGAFDALALWDLTTVAILGKVASLTQVMKIMQTKPAEIIILLDAAALKDAVKTAKKFVGLVPKVSLAVLWNEEDDPSSNPEAARKAIKEAINYFDLLML